MTRPLQQLEGVRPVHAIPGLFIGFPRYRLCHQSAPQPHSPSILSATEHSRLKSDGAPWIPRSCPCRLRSSADPRNRRFVQVANCEVISALPVGVGDSRFAVVQIRETKLCLRSFPLGETLPGVSAHFIRLQCGGHERTPPLGLVGRFTAKWTGFVNTRRLHRNLSKSAMVSGCSAFDHRLNAPLQMSDTGRDSTWCPADVHSHSSEYV
jgi:hypothetical protein